jgi:hypothetical protein
MPQTREDLPALEGEEAGLEPILDGDETARVEEQLLRTRDDPQARNFELVSVLANLRQPALVLDEAGTVAFSNRAALRMFGSGGPVSTITLADIGESGRVALLDATGRLHELDARVMRARWGDGRGRIVLLRPSGPRTRPAIDERTARSAAVGRLRAARAAIESGLDRLREHGGTAVVDHAVVALRALIQELDHVSVALDAIDTDPGAHDRAS